MKKSFNLIIVSCFATLVLSCKEDVNLNLPNNQQNANQSVSSRTSKNIKIKEGRVTFNSMDEMKEFMKETEKFSPKMLESLIGDKFKSHYKLEKDSEKISHETINENKLDLKDTPILDHFYASLLNKDREIEIGNDTIYKIGNDFCFYYHKSNANLVEDFYKDLKRNSAIVKLGELKLFYDNKLTVYGTVINKKTAKLSDKKDANKGSKMMLVEEYYYFDPNFRMKAEYYTHSYLGYATIGVQTKMEKYGTVWVFFNGWKSENADYINVNFKGGYYTLQFYNGFPLGLLPAFPNYSEGYNNSEAYIRVDWFVGPLGNFNWQFGQAEHTVRYGNTHTIYSNY